MNEARILLVDDDEASGQIVANCLAQLGYAVTFADGPAQADAALRQGSFDVILSDIQMPGNRRLQWIERLFQTDCPPPVVLMTGDPNLDTAIRSANLPVAAYLLKPVNYAELRATLSRLAGEYRRRVELQALADYIANFLAASGAENVADPRLREQLQRLAQSFAAVSARGTPTTGPVPPGEEMLRSAIADAVAVIKQTKGSFHSKELGSLRARLQQMLSPNAA